jgi:hypothetical protein
MKANEINYGGVTFEDYQKAADTVRRYLDGLTNTHQIHDKLTEEAMKALTADSMMVSLPLISISRAHERFTEALKAQMIRDGHMPKPEDNTEATEENL